MTNDLTGLSKLVQYSDTGADDVPDQDDDFELPKFGDAESGPCGRPLNKPGYALHLIEGDGSVESFRYFHLDSGSSYQTNKTRRVSSV